MAFGESIYMCFYAFKMVQMLAVCMLPGNVLLLNVTTLCRLSYKEPLVNYFSTDAMLHWALLLTSPNFGSDIPDMYFLFFLHSSINKRGKKMNFSKPSTLEITPVALCGDIAASPVGASHFLSDPDRTALEPLCRY